jgi:hypothetical protein
MAMQRTLLEIVQDILSSIQGDSVTDISDTQQSTDVANIVRQNFYEIAATLKLPEHYTLFELTETSSSTPVQMTKPASIITIDWIKYDTEDDIGYTEPKFIPFKEFLEMMEPLSTDYGEVDSFNFSMNSETFPLKYFNDRNPSYYTTPDQETLIFDGVDTSIESFLRKTKTECFGLKENSWTHTNAGVPPLDQKYSNLLFQQSKAQCFAELKQTENPRAQRSEKRAQLSVQRRPNAIDNPKQEYWTKYPNYGRNV